MFFLIKKSDCLKQSSIPSTGLSNTLKYKIDANIFLKGSNVAELYHPHVLLIDILKEAPVHRNLSNAVISSSSLSCKSQLSPYNSNNECVVV